MATQQTDLGFETEITVEQSEAQTERDRVREEYRERLAEKLKDPEFRKIEGFPIGTDEAILALSDPPYYTACPNPFIEEWLAENGKPYDAATDTYHREPFAADVSEGKNDPIYNAHSYHTKVPHKAIMRYILHYTEPGDVVYDGFCGTGMTGVAAQMCGNKAQVESLGYRVKDDDTILDETGNPFSKLGARKAILNDLSPAATFIAHSYNTYTDKVTFARDAKRILTEVEAECGWMYNTLHHASESETTRVTEALKVCSSTDELQMLYEDLKAPESLLRDPESKLQVAKINFTVWSDVFLCPNCTSEIIFWHAAVDLKSGRVKDTFLCETCLAETSKKKANRAFSSFYDRAAGRTVTQFKQVPVLINYEHKSKLFEKKVDAHDKALIFWLDAHEVPHRFPAVELPRMHETHVRRRTDLLGVSHVHHFYTKRNLWLLAAIAAKQTQQSHFLLQAVAYRLVSRLTSYQFGRAGNKSRSGTLYISSLPVEANVLNRCTKKLKDALAGFAGTGQNTIISTQSTTTLVLENVDFVFIDPPFGANIMYSELNFLHENWHEVQTNNKDEAIENETQNKTLAEYKVLMSQCFEQCYSALKPGRWAVVEFHNSANAVWNVIQEGLFKSGFVICDTRVLDKKVQAIVAAGKNAGAVDKDLLITCYKPSTEFENLFKQIKGKPEGVIVFVRQHLAMLPVAPVTKSGKLEPVAERSRYLLFDRMIAYHLQKSAPIPLDAAPFYKMLEEQFTCRDEMYFLPEQAARFDALKLQGMETEQLSIFVQDEKTAVQWVRGALAETPQTLGELTPTFMQELRDWPAHEPRPELKDLLREYFIHSDDGVWRVPNPDDEKDIEQLRKNALLRLFRDYTKAKGPLKVFRKEAIIQGFTTCYETNQHGVIVSLCEKIPEKIRDEIQEFVMFYDIAKSLAPPEIVQNEFVFE